MSPLTARFRDTSLENRFRESPFARSPGWQQMGIGAALAMTLASAGHVGSKYGLATAGWSIAFFALTFCALLNMARLHAAGARRAYLDHLKLERVTELADHYRDEAELYREQEEYQEVFQAEAEAHARLAAELDGLRRTAEKHAEFADAILENVSQGVAVFDRGLRLVRWNDNYARMISLPDDLLQAGTPLSAILEYSLRNNQHYDARTRAMIGSAMDKLAAGSSAVFGQAQRFELRNSDGAWIETVCGSMPDGGSVFTFSDISERKRTEVAMRQMALIDPLTGLANRSQFNDRLAEALSLADRRGHCVGLLMIDLDHFKAVNDSHGHLVGDDLLCAVAARLSEGVRQGDTVARFGGDEFSIVLNAIDTPQAALASAQRILDCLAAPVLVDGIELDVGASIGVAVYPSDVGSLDELVKIADDALYTAKRGGRACFVAASERLCRKAG